MSVQGISENSTEEITSRPHGNWKTIRELFSPSPFCSGDIWSLDFATVCISLFFFPHQLPSEVLSFCSPITLACMWLWVVMALTLAPILYDVGDLVPHTICLAAISIPFKFSRERESHGHWSADGLTVFESDVPLIPWLVTKVCEAQWAPAPSMAGVGDNLDRKSVV